MRSGVVQVERSWGTPWPAECFGLNLPWVEGGAMQNLMALKAVDQAVHWAVHWAGDGAVAKRGAVAALGAIAQREEPPHPGLGLYLGGVV